MVTSAARTAAASAISGMETLENSAHPRPPLSSQDSLSPQSDLSLLEEEVRNGIHRSLGGGALPLPEIPHHRGIFEFERSGVGVV